MVHHLEQSVDSCDTVLSDGEYDPGRFRDRPKQRDNYFWASHTAGSLRFTVQQSNISEKKGRLVLLSLWK